MKSSPRVVAALLGGLALSVWAQAPDGSVREPAAPARIYSSSPPAIAARPASAAVAHAAARPATFAAASVSTAARMSVESREERRFLRDAAAESRFELDASRLAFSKSGNIAVRTLASALISHHNNLGLELTHLLNTRGMALPMLGNDQRKALNRMAKLHGKRFDSAYIEQVGLAQAGVARDFEKASVTIHEPQVHAWILKTLPATRYHLLLAERAAPADPRASKGNHSAGRATVARAPAAARMPQAQPRGPGAHRGVVATGASGVQPVAATRDRLSVSGNR